MSKSGIKVVDIDFPWRGGLVKAHLELRPVPGYDNPFDRVVAGLLSVNGKPVHHVSKNERAMYIARWPYKFMELVANEIPVDHG